MTHSIDLHIHTRASDGLYTSSEVVALARAAGLQTIAITDHDTVDGVAAALEAAQGTGMEVIPGVELSTEAPRAEAEVHVLGYYVDYRAPAFVAQLARFRESRLGRAQTMLSKLADLGITLAWERVQALAGDGSVGRPHVARALLEAGYVSSVQEAFDRYLERGKPAYVQRFKVTPEEAVQLILQAGGVPVLAHPWEVLPLAPALAATGLMGLEAYYGNYSAEAVAWLCKQAQQLGLLCTGGSDFHGLVHWPENRLGIAHVPVECVAALRERRRLL